jgi:hypothetical protein
MRSSSMKNKEKKNMIRLCNLILLLYVLSERRSGILMREY